MEGVLSDSFSYLPVFAECFFFFEFIMVSSAHEFFGSGTTSEVTQQVRTGEQARIDGISVEVSGNVEQTHFGLRNHASSVVVPLRVTDPNPNSDVTGADRNNNRTKEAWIWGEEVEIETRNLGFYGVGRPTFESREVLRPSGRSTLWSLFNPDDERKADRNNNSNKEVSVWGEEVEIETRNLGFYGVGRPTFKSREEGETDDEIRVFEEVVVHIVNPVVFAEERAPEIEEEEEEEQEEPW
ncbi:hypothetical protein NE237_025549 [Protea cynaroides]|uniref:Uncharacterized protein n=1 Tax=Protea cynaroides TaxID=273540 RepID=A0A9Q0H2K4_9MAGN|nr:hypothetical protein NE237_025549 [Protea cynaroides]